MYTYMYIETRETRERERLVFLSPHLLIFYHVTCSHISILFFLSLASKCHVHVRRRKTASVVHIFLFPRASQGIVVGHTWRVRDTKRDGAYFVRDKKKKVFAHYYVYTPPTRISHFKLPLFKNLLFKITLFGKREQLAKATSFHHGRNGNETHCEKH